MINLKNAKEYMHGLLYIRTKEAKLERFRMNLAQERLYAAIKEQHLQGKPIRIIILKARQLGFSTVTEAIMFQRTVTKENVRTLILAHRADSTANLFRMNKLFYTMLPKILKPMLSNKSAQELVFENPERDAEKKRLNPGLNSSIRCNTAGGDGVGRSDTVINVHASEFAFWKNPKEIWSGLIQAVPALPGTMVVVESTANGFNEFKKMWDSAVAKETDFIPLFFAWWENPEYAMPVPHGTIWSKEEKALQKTYKISPEQLQWRRWCIKNNCANDERKFRQEYPASPDEAFLTSGRTVFNNEVVMERRRAETKPLKVGYFAYDYDELSITNIRWVDSESGHIAIYKNPKKRRHYVLGGDTAGEGSDRFTAWVIDNKTSAQVARFACVLGEAEYARQVYCMATHYNEALVGLEVNFNTYPTMELVRLGYHRLYVREKSDTYTGKLRESFGFRTDGVTRPVLIARLVEMFDQHPQLFNDMQLLGEMLTFAYNEEGRPEALEGEHDDLIMGLGIAYAIRNQQEYNDTAMGFSTEGWTEDMLEDYYRAGAQEKAYLRSKWGRQGEEDGDDE